MPDSKQNERSGLDSAPDQNAETQSLPPGGARPPGSGPDPSPERDLPESFGRYRVSSLLGKGGYGAVYRAVDDQLQRDVAVKVTHSSLLDPALRESFLTEARIVAALDHPNIVPVLDVGQTEQGDFYIVSKLIEGTNLAERIKRDRPDRLLALRIVEQIADALHYAHGKGLVHRDVKPANILLDRQNRPYLTDFGIALRESEQRKKGETVGTPAYMSPEQARGLGHRIDNRSDIYSLGVVLYELITGRRPFHSENRRELMKLVAAEDVRSPRLFEDTIPPELERICLKALERRASGRYTVARDFADEIRSVLAQQVPASGQRPAVAESPASGTPITPVTPLTPHPNEITPRTGDSQRTGPTQVVPKGLRSFDASDAGFFLELLPGPFDREGLPDSLRFWKTRIEQTDPERTFKVGLVYGPSGCGKSSLMKAGLLPRLSPKVVPVYVEAGADETEARLLRGVKRAIPDAEGNSLKEVLSSVRRQRLAPSGGKLLLVIDQFEQWLFAEPNYARSSLTDALLECDGSAVQAIVLVRDDFWISVSRFLGELDIPLVERENSAMVDLFSQEHAAKVLGLFGKAYGKLPDSSKEWSADQQAFIREAIAGLAQDDRVISVRVAVLAEMLRTKPWTTAALREVGGIEGVGVTFLEEMFGARHAPLQHRRHEAAVRGLLGALLPASGTDIKGAKRSVSELQAAAGYEQQPREFAELLGILDKNLRLITPVDADDRSTLVPNRAEAKTRSAAQAEPAGAAERLGQSFYYQLAHDYLVPSLREWLTRKQRETKKGRAELKLAERTAVWSAKPENKQLPTLVEWFQIRTRTEPKRWTAAEQKLMRTAARVHGLNWGSSLLVLALLAGTVGYVFQRERQRSMDRQIIGALDSLQGTLGPSVKINIEKLVEFNRPDLILPQLKTRYLSTPDADEKLALAFGLAGFDAVEIEYSVSRIDSIPERDRANLIRALSHARQRAIERLKQAASECANKESWERKARLALVALGLGDTGLAQDVCEFEGRTDHGPRTWFIEEFPKWELNLGEVIDAVASSDSPALRSAICLGMGRVTGGTSGNKTRMVELATKWFQQHPDSSTHSAAAWLLRQWEVPEPKVEDAGQVIAGRDWFVNSAGMTMLRIKPPAAKPESEVTLVDPLAGFREQLAELKDIAKDKLTPAQLQILAMAHFQTGDYAAALVDLNELLEGGAKSNSEQLPVYRILALSRLGRHEDAAAEFEKLRSTLSKQTNLYLGVQLAAFRGDPMQALDLLGTSRDETPDDGELYDAACAAALCAGFFSETDPVNLERFKTLSLELLAKSIEAGWSNGQHLSQDPDFWALHAEPAFVALVGEIFQRPDKTALPKSEYWFARCEVTRGQFEAFMQDSADKFEKPTDWSGVDTDISPTADHPAQQVSWYDAVMYCNWLSHKEGKTPAYRKTGRKEKGGFRDEEEYDQWELVADATGYRLPLEEEWEFATRAGSRTEWSSGDDDELLKYYCQMYPSKLAVAVGHKLPNAWGLQDVHGNVWEWCSDLVDGQGSFRVLRGGSWSGGAAVCRSARRFRYYPSLRNDGSYGFRVALSSPSGIPRAPEAGAGK